MARPAPYVVLVLLLPLVPACRVQTPAERLRDQVRAADSVTYEFHWRRAFDPHVLVRITRHGPAYDALVITYTIPDSPTDTNAILAPVFFQIDTTRVALHRADWNALEAALDGAAFWDMVPEEQDPPGVNIQRVDGADWILGAYSDHGSHVVTRWSPAQGKDSLFSRAALFMVRLAQVRVDSQRIY